MLYYIIQSQLNFDTNIDSFENQSLQVFFIMGLAFEALTYQVNFYVMLGNNRVKPHVTLCWVI